MKKLFLSMVMAGLMAAPCSANSLASTSVANVATAAETDSIYTVTVTTPGTFGQVILQQVENWSDVVELTVKGSLNESDMAYFSRLQNMTKLDLSQTDIKSVGGCKGLSVLETVVLPCTVTVVSEEAFNGCTWLANINLDNITKIEASAFWACANLPANLSLPNAVSIDNDAFTGCTSIKTIDLPKVEVIENGAFSIDEWSYGELREVHLPNVKRLGGSVFYNCRQLQSVDIPNCTEIGGRCFYNCRSLSSVTLSDKLEKIGSYTFSETTFTNIKLPLSLKEIGSYAFYDAGLTEVDIPEGVTTIRGDAFNGCPLETITLPSSLESIGSRAFYCYKEYDENWNWIGKYFFLKDVYCKSVVPLATKTFDNDMAKGATLHVPAFSVSAYKLDDNWYKFGKIEALVGELDDITINNNFTIIEYTGLADKVDLTLTSNSNTAGHLTVSGGSALSLGKFVQNQDFQYDYYWDSNDNRVYYYPYCTTLIANNEVRADNVTTKIQFPSNRWTFLSLPYDVNVSDIKVPEGIMWVVRKYNGANRAAMSGETWENVINGQILNAGEGYIFHCVNDEGNDWDEVYVEFEFPAINNANKNNVFAHNDVTKTLNEYPAEFSHNRGWNLIGNPYPAYFNSHSIDFNAPITVWNGSGYTAYSLADDEYILRPNEAFFVQCPVNSNQITFAKEGRTHEYSSPTNNSSRVKRRVAPNRQILNFVIANEQYTDRARFVINEEAKAEYEIECDASKFMSNSADVPQIYIIDNGVNYAIDERPLGSGKFCLGIRIGEAGTHTVSLNAKNLRCDVLLTDNETGKTVNLTEEDYTFESFAQTYTNRFSVELKSEATAIETVNAEKTCFTVNGNVLTFVVNANVSIVSADGKTIFNGVPSGAITLQTGIYVVSTNGETYKVAIK